MSKHFRVISGGSTGADIAALRAAASLGITTAGWAFKDFWNGKEQNLKLGSYFGLHAMPTRGYAEKEERNVAMCDGLVAFRVRIPKTGRGTESVVHCARFGTYKHQPLTQDHNHSIYLDNPMKPVIVFWDVSEESKEDAARILQEFINKYSIRSLMVTGLTDSSTEPLLEALFYSALQHAATISHLSKELDRLRKELDLTKKELQSSNTQSKTFLAKLHHLEIEEDHRKARALARHVMSVHLSTHHLAKLPHAINFILDEHGCGSLRIQHMNGDFDILTHVTSASTKCEAIRQGPIAAMYLFNIWCAVAK